MWAMLRDTVPPFSDREAARLLAGRLSDERKQAGENPGTPP